jgi:hypothetical protein
MERAPDHSQDLALFGFHCQRLNLGIVGRNQVTQLALAPGWNLLAEHEHVLRLVRIPGLEHGRPPGAVPELRIVDGCGGIDARFGDPHSLFEASDFRIVGDGFGFNLRQGHRIALEPCGKKQ